MSYGLSLKLEHYLGRNESLKIGMGTYRQIAVKLYNLNLKSLNFAEFSLLSEAAFSFLVSDAYPLLD